MLAIFESSVQPEHRILSGDSRSGGGPGAWAREKDMRMSVQCERGVTGQRRERHLGRTREDFQGAQKLAPLFRAGVRASETVSKAKGEDGDLM